MVRRVRSKLHWLRFLADLLYNAPVPYDKSETNQKSTVNPPDKFNGASPSKIEGLEQIHSTSIRQNTQLLFIKYW